MTIFTPTSEDEAAELLRASRAGSLQIAAAQQIDQTTKEAVISTAGMAGIVAYAPEDFTISAYAGTPLDELEKELSANGQRLDFEPPRSSAQVSIGSVAATNASGSRRPFAGSARDALLCARFITGLGEIVSTGSRVLKSVAGLDLSRTLAGSRGRLALLTEVTFRTRAAQVNEHTLIIPDVAPLDFPQLATSILQQGFSMSGAAHLSTPQARNLTTQGTPTAVIRFEDEANTLPRIREAGAEGTQIISSEKSRGLWASINQAQMQFPAACGTLWRATCSPSEGGKLAQQLSSLGADTIIDWRGGLVWTWHPALDLTPNILHLFAKSPSTHARLVSGPITAAPVRRITQAQLRIERAVKQALDPDHTFDSKPYLQGFAGEG